MRDRQLRPVCAGEPGRVNAGHRLFFDAVLGLLEPVSCGVTYPSISVTGTLLGGGSTTGRGRASVSRCLKSCMTPMSSG